MVSNAGTSRVICNGPPCLYYQKDYKLEQLRLVQKDSLRMITCTVMRVAYNILGRLFSQNISSSEALTNTHSPGTYILYQVRKGWDKCMRRWLDDTTFGLNFAGAKSRRREGSPHTVHSQRRFSPKKSHKAYVMRRRRWKLVQLVHVPRLESL